MLTEQQAPEWLKASVNIYEVEGLGAALIYLKTISAQMADPAIHVVGSHLCHRAGKHLQARRILQSGVALYGLRPVLRTALAENSILLGEIEEADALLDKATLDTQPDANFYRVLAKFYMACEEFARVEEIANNPVVAENSSLAVHIAEELAWCRSVARGRLITDRSWTKQVTGPESLILASTLSEVECKLIRQFADAGSFSKGRVGSGRYEQEIRQADVQMLPVIGEMEQIMVKVIAAVFTAARELMLSPLHSIDRPQVIRYTGVSRGHYSWHRDTDEISEPIRRCLTTIIQLSDENSYEGGSLTVRVGGVNMTASKRCGQSTSFRADSLHSVSNVVSGERFSLVCWGRLKHAMNTI